MTNRKSPQNAKKNLEVKKDPKKESYFKQLSANLMNLGVSVRREKLGAGPGWKAMSGACRLDSQALLFVDPRLPQEDQILFLKNRLHQLGHEVPEYVEV